MFWRFKRKSNIAFVVPNFKVFSGPASLSFKFTNQPSAVFVRKRTEDYSTSIVRRESMLFCVLGSVRVSTPFSHLALMLDVSAS